MKKYLILLLLVGISFQIHAQDIQFDIFGNLEYESKDRRYKAYLKKDIFDNLIFTDSNKNELSFQKKYLDLTYNNVLAYEENNIGFFRHLIYRYITESGYKASYKADIFDTVVIEDNLKNKVEIGDDIFGNSTYEAKINGSKISMKKDLLGNLEYRSDKDQAFLKKDIFKKWTYSDNSGNKFEFSDKTWEKLKYKYASEEDILFFMVNKFLLF